MKINESDIFRQEYVASAEKRGLKEENKGRMCGFFILPRTKTKEKRI